MLRAFGQNARRASRRPGDFNVYNALAAYAVAQAAGLDPGAIDAASRRGQARRDGWSSSMLASRSRCSSTSRTHRNRFGGYLCYMRERSRGRIIAVFGCIGERDRERRYRMGQVAAESADYTIVTDDNPYSEDRDAIIDEIARGLREAGKREGHDFAVIPDRREAIEHAIGMAVDGDAVLLAGKGHEREVHLPDATYPCHDPSVAREVLRDLGYAR